MKTTTLLGLAAISLAAMTSCSSVKSISSEGLSGEWGITKIDGKKVEMSADAAEPYIAFDVVNGRFFGHAGCNSIMGSFATGEENELQFTSTGVTMMMCPDIETEDAILKALAQVKQYNITKAGDLELSNASDKTLLYLVKRPDTISPAVLAGEWHVLQLGDIDLTANTEEDYTIAFNAEDSTFSMTTGCNNVSGNFFGTFVDVKFDNLRSTRMACPDMTVEQTASQVLPTINSFAEFDNSDSYGFYDANGNLVMTIASIPEE